MSSLYPLKFKPRFKEKPWGGQQIRTVLRKEDPTPACNCGELWVVSGISGQESEVENGHLEGRKLTELCEEYGERLLGKKVHENYRKNGRMFPLLIKFIDTADWLSLQVHPVGKTEMWYVLQASPDAELISGFKTDANDMEIVNGPQQKALKLQLNVEQVKAGDVFFVPAGRIHAIGAGILLAEIQQSSDITYRIHDWGRLEDGHRRELHKQSARKTIDFQVVRKAKTLYERRKDAAVWLIDCPEFTTRLLDLKKEHFLDYSGLDSFVILLCTGGKSQLRSKSVEETLTAGEAILLPAEIRDVKLIPEPDDGVELLETFIP